jgi:predicted DNA-binding transcriptional regulator YafY
MATWFLLTNHALVLYHLARKPLITAREVAASVGITERAVRKIIADLDAARFIHKAREGRRVRYTVNPEVTLRKNTLSDVPILDFLHALGWKK